MYETRLRLFGYGRCDQVGGPKDPGMAFGTGTHATTKMRIEDIDGPHFNRGLPTKGITV